MDRMDKEAIERVVSGAVLAWVIAGIFCVADVLAALILGR